MSSSADPGSGVWVVAHRGARRERPENTLAAFDEALRQGCDAIELDLQLSSDGVPVVYHDRTLDRVGLEGKPVGELDSGALRRLDVGAPFDKRFAGEHIPTLREVLERFGGRVPLLLELKPEEQEKRRQDLVRSTLALVHRYNVEESVHVLSFDPVILREAAEISAALPRVLNIRPRPLPGHALWEALASLAALSVDIRSLTLPFARAVRRAGCPLWTFTCNRPRQVDRALAAGACAVISDRPAWLATYLRDSGVER